MAFLEWLLGNRLDREANATSSGCAIVGTRRLDGKPVIEVQRSIEPFYLDRGWQVKRRDLHGYYRTKFGAYQGYIEKAFSNPTFYIIQPPRQLLSGDHSACFNEVKKNRFSVHWNRKPDDVNCGILWMEHYILEAFQS